MNKELIIAKQKELIEYLFSEYYERFSTDQRLMKLIDDLQSLESSQDESKELCPLCQENYLIDGVCLVCTKALCTPFKLQSTLTSQKNIILKKFIGFGLKLLRHRPRKQKQIKAKSEFYCIFVNIIKNLTQMHTHKVQTLMLNGGEPADQGGGFSLTFNELSTPLHSKRIVFIPRRIKTVASHTDATI